MGPQGDFFRPPSLGLPGPFGALIDEGGGAPYTEEMRLPLAVLLAPLLYIGASAQEAADPPLITALKAGDSATVRALAKDASARDAKDRFGWTGAMWAAGHADAATLKLLLDAGASVSAPGYDALGEAARNGAAANIPLLAAKGLDCSAKDASGAAPLHYAAAVSAAAVDALLACKAKVNARDADGRTALTRAAQMGRADVVKKLLAAGAKVNLKDRLGYTALMWAAHEGRVDAVKALRAAKADPGLKALDGQTAQAMAASRGHADAAASAAP